jgi:hypothetical protein
MIESFVIFFYGITNTWMERIGATPGSPFTIKQVQHISIAVMFWFGGMSGMGLESRVIRRLLASSAVRGKIGKTVKEPKSYSFSFNPFPALVIGIVSDQHSTCSDVLTTSSIARDRHVCSQARLRVPSNHSRTLGLLSRWLLAFPTLDLLFPLGFAAVRFGDAFPTTDRGVGSLLSCLRRSLVLLE